LFEFVDLILLPGLGADHRQFEPQRAEFPELVVPPWIASRPRESLPDYAARMGSTIPHGPNVLLGGSSFGGMVACEMARHVRPAAVVLIGSCRSPRAIRPVLRRLRPIVPLVPATSLRVAKCLAPAGVRVLSRLGPEQRKLCVAMFRDADPRFVKWGAWAILQWQRSPPLDGIPVRQIHGARDRIIWAARVQADELIPDGGHLINMTHAGQVNRFLRGVAHDVD
jgi:pimeloyl-ACP methyl ester carboxylesterase